MHQKSGTFVEACKSVCVYTNGPAEVLKLFLLLMERALLEFGFQYLSFFGFQVQLLLQKAIPTRKKFSLYQKSVLFC